jgi:hypothetical protein
VARSGRVPAARSPARPSRSRSRSGVWPLVYSSRCACPPTPETPKTPRATAKQVVVGARDAFLFYRGRFEWAAARHQETSPSRQTLAAKPTCSRRPTTSATFGDCLYKSRLDRQPAPAIGRAQSSRYNIYCDYCDAVKGKRRAKPLDRGRRPQPGPTLRAGTGADHQRAPVVGTTEARSCPDRSQAGCGTRTQAQFPLLGLSRVTAAAGYTRPGRLGQARSTRNGAAGGPEATYGRLRAARRLGRRRPGRPPPNSARYDSDVLLDRETAERHHACGRAAPDRSATGDTLFARGMRHLLRPGCRATDPHDYKMRQAYPVGRYTSRIATSSDGFVYFYCRDRRTTRAAPAGADGIEPHARSARGPGASRSRRTRVARTRRRHARGDAGVIVVPNPVPRACPVGPEPEPVRSDGRARRLPAHARGRVDAPDLHASRATSCTRSETDDLQPNGRPAERNRPTTAGGPWNWSRETGRTCLERHLSCFGRSRAGFRDPREVRESFADRRLRCRAPMRPFAAVLLASPFELSRLCRRTGSRSTRIFRRARCRRHARRST